MQFKISLRDVSPRVWRRIQVPDDYSFWDLHCAIQDAMGWMNGHLHAFTLSRKNGKTSDAIRIQMPNDLWEDDEYLDESKVKLNAWLPGAVKQCLYMYDFGDGWDHTVLFEGAFPLEEGIVYPRCIAGKNDCPPEDCGGPQGYMHMRSVINKASSREGKEMREWIGLEKGEKFDPSQWSCADVEFEDPKAVLKEFLKDQERYG